MYRTDNPVLDAERASRDTRRVVAHCDVCGKELRQGSYMEDPDEAYEIEGEMICSDCIYDYLRTRLRWRGGDYADI